MEFIRQLPHGLESVIGEKGVLLWGEANASPLRGRC